MWFLNRVINPGVRALLRSPLHPLLSGRLTLLRVTGRRSGRTFELPVGYKETGERLSITVAAAERKRWWRNVVGPTPVTLVFRGRTRSGVAERIGTAGAEVRIEVSLR